MHIPDRKNCTGVGNCGKIPLFNSKYSHFLEAEMDQSSLAALLTIFGGALIIILAVVISVVSTFVSTVASVVDDEED